MRRRFETVPLTINRRVAIIHLTKGFHAVVDVEDFHAVSRHSWYAMIPKSANRTKYAATRIGNTIVLLHRFITGAPRGKLVDHWNHNGLDDKRMNLRVCSPSQNGGNSRKARKNKGFKGVYQSGPHTFLAYIRPLRHKIHLGSFRFAEDAARAYDRAARQHWGEFALVNFPEEPLAQEVLNAA